jgi:peptidoglycan/LPS O-acetylase OafA/YrhL
MIPHFDYISVCEPWRIVPILLLILGLFSWRRFNFLNETARNNDNRLRTLDGLRGFLALGVFFSHAADYYGYLTMGDWADGPSTFFNQAGRMSVALFFIITGYLFWKKAIVSRKTIHDAKTYFLYLKSLYISRFFRIAPLYYFAVFAMLTTVFASTGPHLNVSSLKCIKEVTNWMLLGFGGMVPVNGSHAAVAMLVMIWTLRLEWFYYFSLAATSLIAFSSKLRLAFPVIALVISEWVVMLNPLSMWRYILYFSIGMIVATLPCNHVRLRIPESLQSIAVVALIGFAYFHLDPSHPVGLNISLAALFFLISNGCDIFGLLNTRGAQRLGAISYSIYLTHGLCLHWIFSNTRVQAFAFTSVTQYWAVVLLAALTTTLLASLTFALIERPGIALGRRLSDGSKPTRSGRNVNPVSLA